MVFIVSMKAYVLNIGTHVDCLFRYKQEKRLMALWTGFLNNEEIRVVSLACETSTGPPLHPYQT